MIGADAMLDDLLGQLRAMTPADRAFVLDQLGEDQVRLLAPRLMESPLRPLSAELASLAAECADGRVAPGIRSRAAAAIGAAVGAAAGAGRAGEVAAASPAPRRASWRARTADFLAGR